MKRQKLFHILPGVTAAVLAAQPACAGDINFDGIEFDSSLDSSNPSRTISTSSREQILAQKLYSVEETSTDLSSINSNTVKSKPVKSKTILSRVPEIKQVSLQRHSRIDLNTGLRSLNQSNTISNLGDSLSQSKEKTNKVAAADKQNSQPANISTSALIIRTANSNSTSLPISSRAREVALTKQINPESDSRLDSLSGYNVSQNTDGLTSSRQKNNCEASASLGNSSKCDNRVTARRERISSSKPISPFPAGKLGKQNSTSTRKPSLANKLQGLKQVTDRNSILESNILESSSKTQLVQEIPQQTTPPTTEESPQQTTPPTTEESPQQTTPPTTEENPQQTTPPPTEGIPQQTTPQTTQPPVDPNAPPPDYLNPNPNPLVFPSKSGEVRIRGTQPITLEQALDLARRNNRDLQVSLLQLKRQQAVVRQQQAALFPQLSLSGNLGRSQDEANQLRVEAAERAGQPVNPDTDEPTPTTFRGQVELDYQLYTSGARLARIRVAEEQLKSNELDVERLSEEIRLGVLTDYYNLQQADENVRIQRSAVDNARASLRDAEALERAGVGTRFDVLQSQTDLANAIQQLNNAIATQAVRRSQLAQRLSLPKSVNIAAADPVKLAGLWNKSLEESLVLAFQNRPELQQQLAQRNVGEQNRRLALSALGPQVSLVGRYNLLDQFDDGVGVTDGYSVQLQASLNLFDGGAARAQANQEKANIAIAETGFAQTREEIRSQVEQAYAQLQSNLRNVETSNVGLEQARESLRLARLRFQAGVGTQTAVIDQQNALARAEGNRVDAIVGYNLALAQLQRAVTSRGLASSDNSEGDGGNES